MLMTHGVRPPQVRYSTSLAEALEAARNKVGQAPTTALVRAGGE